MKTDLQEFWVDAHMKDFQQNGSPNFGRRVRCTSTKSTKLPLHLERVSHVGKA